MSFYFYNDKLKTLDESIRWTAFLPFQLIGVWEFKSI